MRPSCVLVFALATLSAVISAPIASETPTESPFHRGICIEGGPPLELCHIDEFNRLGATHVSLNPFGWMSAPDDPNVRLSTRKGGGRWWGEGDEGLKAYAQAAHNAGLTVMLRPHIWLRSGANRRGETGLWLADVAFETEEEWQTFFSSYREFALHYARLAEDAGMEWYSIGAELTRTSVDHPDYWRSLIAEVREVYHGKLTYSGNWWEEAEGITFWDALDAIGVQAYMPLTEVENATAEEMRSAWDVYLDALQRLSDKCDRPVIFTEIGYKSTTCAGISPWEWRGTGETSTDFQERCYNVAFDALRDRAWFKGMYWWKYHVAPCNQDLSENQRRVRDFSFQDKPAENVLIREYSSGK